MVMGMHVHSKVDNLIPSSPGVPSLMGEADTEMIIVTTKLTYGVELVYAVLEQGQ